MGKLVFIVIVLLWCTNTSFGQVVDLRFQFFKHNNEISSTYVTSIAQDHLDFMWIGTSNGLNRFNGYEFKKYLVDNGENFGIIDFNITKLFADSKKRLWISLNTSLCRYDFNSDSIIVVSNENQLNGLHSPFVKNYLEKNDSSLYVSDINTIYRLNENLGTFEEVVQLKTGELSNFCFDNNDNIWIGSTDNGLYYYDNSKKSLQNFILPTIAPITNNISDLLFYNNLLWIATNGSGIVSFNTSTKTVKNYPVDNDYALNVKDIYVDKENYLWIVDFTGLKIYVQDRDFFQGYYPEQTNNYSIKSHINSIFQDNNFNYWTAHLPGGIGFSAQAKGFQRFDSKVNSPFRLSVDQVSAISEDRFGNLYMGNPFNGISVFNWQKGKTDYYNYSPNNKNCLGKGAVNDIFQDSKQQVWIGTYWGGLQLFLNESGTFINYTNNPTDPFSISTNDVRAITEDKMGNIWVCTHGKGIDMLDKNSGRFINYNAEKNGLSNNYTFDIICDKQNNIWVATAWGLSVLENGKSTFRSFLHSPDSSNCISSNIINTVYEDSNNGIWIGTPKGLNLYKPDLNAFENYDEGFVNPNIVSITNDKDGNLWVGTLFGISRFNYETKHILNLNTNDGLISNDLLPRAVFNNGKNTLFFGSLHGITYFDPSIIKYNTFKPKVFLTKFTIQNKEQTNHNSKYLTTNIITAKSIKVDYNQKVIGFEFAALNFVDSEKNSYAYYLDGFENEWNYVGNKREATYTNLNPGRYTFKVKAANNEGIWNDEGISIELIVTPPIWATWWLRLLLVVAIVAIVVFYIFLRERKLQNNRIELENKIQERTREVISQNLLLERQKLELQKANELKNKFYSILAHDLRGPVYSLVQLVSLLKQNYTKPKEELNPKIIEMIDQSTQNTYNLLDDLLLWGKAQSKNIHIEGVNIDLQSAIETTIANYLQIANEKGITFSVNIPQNTIIFADLNCIKTAIRNLVSNAIKFSYPNSQIVISAEIRNKDVLISIQDVGVGIHKDNLELLFNPISKHSTPGTNGEKGTGLGLSLTYEFIKQNNGSIWVESELNKGTTFFISLPLKK